MMEECYLSWKTGAIGQTIEQEEATLEEYEQYTKSKEEPKKTSGKQELFEHFRDRYLYG
jgi:xylose isomerase